ncbi:hypothetical protein [Paraburkholderia adhaesiva]|uniref:hypothetical protein n=1 Tax=Paraburkholderia adhaesiva TaxID=2883244 RepID=UPI001F18CF28|nr:hypothetical protein [Paraburkholderia adhaesiva]
MADAFLRIANSARLLDSSQLTQFVTPAILDAVSRYNLNRPLPEFNWDIAVALKDIHAAAGNGTPYSPSELQDLEKFGHAWFGAPVLCSQEVRDLPSEIGMCDPQTLEINNQPGALRLSIDQRATIKMYRGEFDYLMDCPTEEAFKAALDQCGCEVLKITLPKKMPAHSTTLSLENRAAFR